MQYTNLYIHDIQITLAILINDKHNSNCSFYHWLKNSCSKHSTQIKKWTIVWEITLSRFSVIVRFIFLSIPHQSDIHLMETQNGTQIAIEPCTERFFVRKEESKTRNDILSLEASVSRHNPVRKLVGYARTRARLTHCVPRSISYKELCVRRPRPRVTILRNYRWVNNRSINHR